MMDYLYCTITYLVYRRLEQSARLAQLGLCYLGSDATRHHDRISTTPSRTGNHYVGHVVAVDDRPEQPLIERHHRR